MISHDAASADSLLTANAELRGALAKAELQIKAWIEIGARAQAVAEAAQDYRTAVTSLDGISAAEERLWAALTVYEAAEKARME